jgi:hypothetical protein
MKERNKRMFENRVDTVITLKLRDDLDKLRSTIDLNHLKGNEGKMLHKEKEFQDLLGKDEEDVRLYILDHKKK